MNQETIIHFRKRVIKLISVELPDTLDVDEVTKIDYSNLFGEIITCPVALNKIGNLMSEAEEDYEKEKVRCKITIDSLSSHHRKNWTSSETKFTEKKLEERVRTDPKYKEAKYKEIQAQKNLNFAKNWFFAMKDKSDHLKVLMKPIKPEDYENEIIEGVVNTYMIKIHEKKYS